MDLHDISPDFLVSEREGQHFDRKSARVKPKDIAKTIAAFANAEGGILAIGVEDNGELTLENSIASRHLHSVEKMETMISPYVLEALNKTEFDILRLVYACGRTTLKEAQARSGTTRYRCRNALQGLVNKGLLEQHSSGKKDPQKYYTLGASR